MISEAMITEIQNMLEVSFGRKEEITNITAMIGGDINAVYLIESKIGKFVIKVNYGTRYPELFKKEKEGLEALRNSKTISVPKVYGISNVGSEDFIVLEYIEKESPALDFWEQFGSGLAKLHKCSANDFGFHSDNYIGTLNQDNTSKKNWIDFFIENRLEPQLEKATCKRLIHSELRLDFQDLYKCIQNTFPEEKSSLLHGDLWSGNFLSGPKGAVLIDPATYYGHREMDLAMTKLFGGFDSSFYHSYNEEYPLEPGWEDRLELCNLYPLLVHLNLFGPTYLNPIKKVLNKYINNR